MEISGCEGFGSKSVAVETSKNQQNNQYGGGRLLLVFGAMPGLIQHTRGYRIQTASN